MTFNNIINHLKLWCINKAETYQKAYGECGGITYVGYIVAYELEFKLSILIDKSFENIDGLKKEILDFVDIHNDSFVSNTQNPSSKYIVDKVNRDFIEYLEELLLKKDTLAFADVPYTRVLVGLEAKQIQERFRSVWGYVNTSYWFPLMGDKPKEVSKKIFIMFDYFEPYMKQLEQIIGLPQTHLYSYGESLQMSLNCFETVELIEYNGLETMYTDKDFSWAIYFSHENTVSFAGSIVDNVKELLSNEIEHWNKFEWD